MFWRAHKLGGRLAWNTLFQPAIELCNQGFKVSQNLALAIKNNQGYIKISEKLKDVFYNPLTDKPLKDNEFIQMPALARTLTILSESNLDEFYLNGTFAQVIVEEINEQGRRNIVTQLNSTSNKTMALQVCMFKNKIIEIMFAL